MGMKLGNAAAFKKSLASLGKDMKQFQLETTNDMANACMAVAVKETPVGDYTKDLFTDTQNKKIRYVSFRKGDGGRATFRIKKMRHGGTLRRGWYVVSGRFIGNKRKAHAETANNVYYAGYVNDGHRIVNRNRATVGWVMGKFMLEKGMKAVEKLPERRFSQVLGEAKLKYGL